MEGELIESLLDGYQIDARPVEHSSHSVDVGVTMYIQAMEEVVTLSNHFAINYCYALQIHTGVIFFISFTDKYSVYAE